MRSSFFVVVFAVLLLTGCVPNADQVAQKQTNEIANEANRQVGMPGVTNFTERKLLKQLYELRDREISTYTYVRDFNGDLHHLCDSIGFGMPFSAQFSNPERAISEYQRGMTTLPMPEPNGLFPPTSSSATWVICADPDGGGFRPIYEESLLTVSTFPLLNVGSYSD